MEYNHSHNPVLEANSVWRNNTLNQYHSMPIKHFLGFIPTNTFLHEALL